MNGLRNSIKNAINDKQEILRKNITLNLSEGTINQLDKISKIFTELNGAKTLSRNFLIESAIESYIIEAKQVLSEDYGINLEDISEEEENEKEANKDINFDTVIFPAHNDGFKEAFLGENCWYAVRVREDKIPKLKHIAIYRAAPVSGITHWAEIDRIEQYKDTNKKIIYFKNTAIELDKPIKLGEKDANSMRSPRYTTKEKLLKANEVKDLF